MSFVLGLMLQNFTWIETVPKTDSDFSLYFPEQNTDFNENFSGWGGGGNFTLIAVSLLTNSIIGILRLLLKIGDFLYLPSRTGPSNAPHEKMHGY